MFLIEDICNVRCGEDTPDQARPPSLTVDAAGDRFIPAIYLEVLTELIIYRVFNNVHEDSFSGDVQDREIVQGIRLATIRIFPMGAAPGPE